MGYEVRKPVFGFANNKGTDQPAHPCLCHLSLTVPSLFTFWIVYLNLLQVKFQFSECGFESHFLKNPEDRFCRISAHMILCLIPDFGAEFPKKVKPKTLNHRHNMTIFPFGSTQDKKVKF